VIVSLTFDVDCQTYTGDATRPMPDELDVAMRALGPVFERHPEWRATWLLRIDPAIDFFAAQVRLLRKLIDRGHGVGWHYHGPIKKIGQFAQVARNRGLDLSRVGFGRGSNQVMRVLAEAGFSIDSTAMPRPAYPWTRRGVDWTTTPERPYRPSVADYRVPGSPSLPILEVPISCTVVAAPGDGQQVVRYLNPAYRPEIFRKSAEAWLGRHSQLVTITHPYEICDGPGHGLLAFDVAAFEQNVAAIERLSGGCEFVTLADLPLQQPLEVASG